MKKFLATSLILSMLLCAAGCGNSATEESSSDTSAATSATDATSSAAETSDADDATETAVNEGEFKAGAYAGNSEYAEGEFSMTWNYVLNLNEDGTFSITDNAGEEKGAGTYALADDCYIMTYSDDRSCTFVVQADGTLKVLNDLPYGKASISPNMVGGIVLEYSGEAVSAPDEETTPTDEDVVSTGDFSITAGAYAASYTKESPMAGTVVYNYAATIGEDGTFSYSVSFEMGGTLYDGCSASGTYTVDGGKFTFTDEIDDFTKLSRQINNSMGEVFDMFYWFGLVMFMLIIYLLSKIIIEKNAQSISMTKILGYTNSEISGLYVITTSIVVIASFILTMPIVDVIMRILCAEIFAAYAGWIPYSVPASVYVTIIAMGIAAYAVIAFLQFRRVKKIPLDTALKNVE